MVFPNLPVFLLSQKGAGTLRMAALGLSFPLHFMSLTLSCWKLSTPHSFILSLTPWAALTLIIVLRRESS